MAGCTREVARALDAGRGGIGRRSAGQARSTAGRGIVVVDARAEAGMTRAKAARSSTGAARASEERREVGVRFEVVLALRFFGPTWPRRDDLLPELIGDANLVGRRRARPPRGLAG